jgi:hypothetical protein
MFSIKIPSDLLQYKKVNSSEQIRFLPTVSAEEEEHHGTGTRSRHADVEEGPDPVGSDDYIMLDESENETEHAEEPEPENRCR